MRLYSEFSWHFLPVGGYPTSESNIVISATSPFKIGHFASKPASTQCPRWVKPGPRVPSVTLLLSHRQRNSTGRRAMSQSCQQKNSAPSFDHLVGATQQRKRDGQAERLGSLEIDDQFDFGDLLNRQVGRLLALENAADVNAS